MSKKQNIAIIWTRKFVYPSDFTYGRQVSIVSYVNKDLVLVNLEPFSKKENLRLINKRYLWTDCIGYSKGMEATCG